MPLLAIFAAFAILGWVRARRAGGGTVDRLRYAFIHGLAAVMVVYVVATLGDWQGFFS